MKIQTPRWFKHVSKIYMCLTQKIMQIARVLQLFA